MDFGIKLKINAIQIILQNLLILLLFTLATLFLILLKPLVFWYTIIHIFIRYSVIILFQILLIFLLFFLVKPLKVKIVSGDELLSAGTTQHIRCESWGSVPPAKVIILLLVIFQCNI